MKKLGYALMITSVMMVLAGCAGSEVLTKPATPKNGYYIPLNNTFYDANPHKDRYEPPLPASYFVDGKGNFVENPDYTP